jgi:hypothetical protein
MKRGKDYYFIKFSQAEGQKYQGHNNNINIKTTRKVTGEFKLLKPTGYVMLPTGLIFNNCIFCPHCIHVFRTYLGTNSDFCPTQRKLIGFYNRDEKCLLRGTNWVFK